MLACEAPRMIHTPLPDDVRLDGYLEEWADYYLAPDGSMGYADHSPVMKTGGYSKSIEEMYQSDVVKVRVKAINVIVTEDMPPACRAAIEHRYRFAVYRFPRGNYPELLGRARELVVRGLRIRHLWIA